MRVLTIIPTYNEIESLPLTLGRLRDAVPESDVLVVDDASPDGTGDWADARAAEDPSVHVLHRTTKDGLGGAYIAGFRWGLERGYDVLVEMDADGSHQPEQLPRLLEAVRTADLVIGSRRVPGGKMVNWPASRKLIRVSIDDEDGGETGDLVERLMGKKPELRFQYISENAQFVEELDV